MQLRPAVLFLTLVASISVQAATVDPSPDFKEAPERQIQPEVDQSKLQSTGATKPPPLSASDLRRAAPFFYPYRNDFSVSAIALFGRSQKGETRPQLISGLQHQFTNSDLKSYVLSGEIISDGTGLLSYSRKWNHSKNRFRPYHQVGLSVLIDPENQFATVLFLSHYFVRLAGGFDYSVGGSFSLRLEALGLLGFAGQQGGAGLALVWGF